MSVDDRSDDELHDALIVGLMSGTSGDGIDAALVHFTEADGVTAWELCGFVSVPYGRARRERILHTVESGSPRDLCRLGSDLGEWMAEAALAVCEQAGVDGAGDVTAIGSHGHTAWHDPPRGGCCGATLQIGDAARLAERTGIQVVSDFRSRDVAAGGHGAPLVPWADQLLFSDPEHNRALQNIGGMSNVTWLPARPLAGSAARPLAGSAARPLAGSAARPLAGSAARPLAGSRTGSAGAMPPVPAEAPFAFDTGPGVALIDAAASAASGGTQVMDMDGRLAAEGSIDEALLTHLMSHPFFSEEPPRSTGRETFGRAMVQELCRESLPETAGEWADLIATLTAFTVRTISEAYARWVIPRGVDEVFITGGGAHNPTLLAWLREALNPLPVFAGAELGLVPDAREAVAFAALAWAHLRGIPANVPDATGARGPRILGSLTPGARL
jgi:anhydro-N-acetylmuramic acid kinase